MKFASGPTKSLDDTKKALITEFKKPKLDSQQITKLKVIKKKVNETVWEFDQRFKTLTGHLSFQIPNNQNKEWFIVAYCHALEFL